MQRPHMQSLSLLATSALGNGDAVPFNNAISNATPAKLIRSGAVNGMAICTKLANECMLMH